MPYIDTMYMSLGQPRGTRELECDQLYGLCTSYQGLRHPVPPPVYDIPTVRLYLVGDSTLYTQTASKPRSDGTCVAMPCGAMAWSSSTRQ